jgi:hypothetical protein
MQSVMNSVDLFTTVYLFLIFEQITLFLTRTLYGYIYNFDRKEIGNDKEGKGYFYDSKHPTKSFEKEVWSCGEKSNY